jgi:hypothetical protein
VIKPTCEAVDFSLDDEFPPEDFFTDDFCSGGDFGDVGSDPLDGLDPSCVESRGGPCSSIRVSRRATNLHDDAVLIRVRLPRTIARGHPCKAKLRLDALKGRARENPAPKLKIGSEPFVLRGGRSKRLAVQIKPAGLRLILRERSISVQVSVLPRGHASGPKVTGPVIVVEAP